MKCPKCNHEIKNNKLNHALSLRSADTFDTEIGNEINSKIRLALRPPDTHDTETEPRSGSCPYCGYKKTISSFYDVP